MHPGHLDYTDEIQEDKTSRYVMFHSIPCRSVKTSLIPFGPVIFGSARFGSVRINILTQLIPTSNTYIFHSFSYMIPDSYIEQQNLVNILQYQLGGPSSTGTRGLSRLVAHGRSQG